MNINRNNYEEYFLLYADNELSATEKKVVEIFVQENVDLREEFLMVKLTVNYPDEEVKLNDKSFLMKAEPPFINENNYEEILVSYFDNELSISQKLETEKFIKENPKYNTEFEIYGKTKLVANKNVVFPDKKKLYRKEKSGKVIPIILWRSMAAAVFIGFGLWISISYFNKKGATNTIALNEKTTKPLITTEVKSGLKNQDDSKNENFSSVLNGKRAQKKNEPDNFKEKQIERINEANENKNGVVKKEIKNKILPEEKAIGIKQKNDKELIASNIAVKNITDKIDGTKFPVLANEVVQHIDKYDESIQPQTQVQTASYAVDNKASDDNYVFYNIKTDEFNKSKVGGFLKKVKRIVERSNPITRLLSGDEKQVAAK